MILYVHDTLLLPETESIMQKKAVEATLEYCKQNRMSIKIETNDFFHA